MTIHELDNKLIHYANSNSFNGTRGKNSALGYQGCAEEIMSWAISDEKKQKLLDKLFEKWSTLLRYESAHVSVMYAGPSNYDSKKLDKGDKILELSADICNWMDELREQVKNTERLKERDINKAKDLEGRIDTCLRIVPCYEPSGDLAKLASMDVGLFIEKYEKLNEQFKFRKNSNVYKLYEKAKSGELKATEPQVFFEDVNFTAWTEGDRAYIRFAMKCQRQLIVALKSRKWWWNAYKSAWSTYLDKLDKEWVTSISTRYASYL